MSYDIFVLDIPQAVTRVEDVPADFVPRPLGPRQRIVEALRRAVPDLALDETGWGSIEGPDYSIEVNLGAEDPISSFAFHVRGRETALFVIADVLNDLGCRAVAPGAQTGIFSLDSDALEAYARWRAYRDHAVGE